MVKTSKVAQHLMHLRAQAKELDIQAQVDAWHARSPNKRLIGSGLFDVDVLGQNCFGLTQVDSPPQVLSDMAPAPALAPAPAPRKRMFSMQKGERASRRQSTSGRRRTGPSRNSPSRGASGLRLTAGQRPLMCLRHHVSLFIMGRRAIMDKLAEQSPAGSASVGKTDLRTDRRRLRTERPTEAYRRCEVKKVMCLRAQLADDAPVTCETRPNDTVHAVSQHARYL